MANLLNFKLRNVLVYFNKEFKKNKRYFVHLMLNAAIWSCVVPLSMILTDSSYHTRIAKIAGSLSTLLIFEIYYIANVFTDIKKEYIFNLLNLKIKFIEIIYAHILMGIFKCNCLFFSSYFSLKCVIYLFKSFNIMNVIMHGKIDFLSLMAIMFIGPITSVLIGIFIGIQCNNKIELRIVNGRTTQPLWYISTVTCRHVLENKNIAYILGFNPFNLVTDSIFYSLNCTLSIWTSTIYWNYVILMIINIILINVINKQCENKFLK